MHEQPTAVDLLDAVAGFLREEAMPALSGRLAFHARVAANVLDIVRRELARGPAADARALERLAGLLGRDGELGALNEALCDRITAGEIGWDDAALIDHLWATTLDTLAVDQPNYGTYRRESAGQNT